MSTEDTSLVKINLETMCMIAKILGVKTNFSVNSDTFIVSKTKSIVKWCGGPWPFDPPTYYAGRGFLNYVVKEELGNMPVVVQKVKETTPNETVLQLIAREPDPLDFIRSCATWEPLM